MFIKQTAYNTFCSLFRLDESGYNIKADIRISDRNKVQLFYNGYRYVKHEATGSVVSWRCYKCSSNPRCKARANTKDANGVTMMKLGTSTHNHDATEKHF